jgi:hypothetical protein
MTRGKPAAKRAARKRPAVRKATHKTTSARTASTRKAAQQKNRLGNHVAVVSSITFHGTALESEFIAGARIGRDRLHHEDDSNGTYNRQKLAKAIHRFNKDDSIGLIVAVGGLGSAMEALSNATKPWIALIGGTPGSFPDSPSKHFRGAVSLEAYVHNDDRISHLTAAHGIPLSQICLLYNPNSACSVSELCAWEALGGAHSVAAGRNDGSGENDSTTYGSAFDAIAGSVRAVMISADPFFQNTKDQLIDAANDWVNAAGTSRRVCYPLRDYANGRATAHQPQAGHCTLHGPKLEDAYRRLGQMAAEVLSGTSSPVVTLPIGRPEDR